MQVGWSNLCVAEHHCKELFEVFSLCLQCSPPLSTADRPQSELVWAQVAATYSG